MRFDLIDAVLELQRTADGGSVRALKQVSFAEEYLKDHFPGFPVLPGVLMLETMVQAARKLVDTPPEHARAAPPRTVLHTVRALKYGAMVRPGDRLVVEIQAEAITKDQAPHGAFDCKGVGRVIRPDADGNRGNTEPETAVSGRFTLRPLAIHKAQPEG